MRLAFYTIRLRPCHELDSNQHLWVKHTHTERCCLTKGKRKGERYESRKISNNHILYGFPREISKVFVQETIRWIILVPLPTGIEEYASTFIDAANASSWWKLFHEIPQLLLSNPLFSLFASESELERSIRCGTDDFPGLDSLLAFLIGMEVGGFNQFSGRRLAFAFLLEEGLEELIQCGSR